MENYGKTVQKGERMREKRVWQNTWLRRLAAGHGLREGAAVLVRERSLLKNSAYITRRMRSGVVLALYPYHFCCLMTDGTKESFRYNEFFGCEARLVRLLEEKEKAPDETTEKNEGYRFSC